jgi:hypothetical protein
LFDIDIIKDIKQLNIKLYKFDYWFLTFFVLLFLLKFLVFL